MQSKSVKNDAAYNNVSVVGGDVSTEQNVADRQIRDDIGKTICSYAFRTSKYKTFKQKMKALSLDGFWDLDNAGVVFLGLATKKAGESFDTVDLFPSEFSPQPLITLRSSGEDEYYTKYIYPTLYYGYSTSGYTVRRDVSEVEIPPLNAILISPYYSYCLSNGDESGMKSVFPYIYKLFPYYKNDYYDLLGQAMNRFINSGSQGGYGSRLINFPYPGVPYGKYKSIVSYTLPGNIKTSEYEIIYKY